MTETLYEVLQWHIHLCPQCQAAEGRPRKIGQPSLMCAEYQGIIMEFAPTANRLDGQKALNDDLTER